MSRGILMRGLFCAFEGIDGCGKSTQLALIAQRLLSEGRNLLTTREPGGTPIAEKIRSLIISPDHVEMCSECELLLYAAARAQHVREKIAPSIQQGTIVLCDRFHIATFAYQGFGRGVSLDHLRMINNFAAGGTLPDLTFIFDISVDVSIARLSAMNKIRDRLEMADREFFERTRAGYQELAQEDPDHCVLLSGELPIAVLSDIVYERIQREVVKNKIH